MMSITKHLAYFTKQLQSLSKKSKTLSPLLLQCQHLMNYIQNVPANSDLLKILFKDIKKHTVKDFPLFIEGVLNNFKSDTHLSLMQKQVMKLQFQKNLCRVFNVFVFMATVLGGGVFSYINGCYAIPAGLFGAFMFLKIEKCAEQKFNQALLMKKAKVALAN